MLYEPGPTFCSAWSLNRSSVEPKNWYLSGLDTLLIADLVLWLSYSPGPGAISSWIKDLVDFM